MRREEAYGTQKDLFKAGHFTRLVPYTYVPGEKRYEYFLEDCNEPECRRDMIFQGHELFKGAMGRLGTIIQTLKKPKLSLVQGGKQ